MSRISLPKLSVTKWIILLLAVTTAIVVARVSIADADHHLAATVKTGIATARSGPGNQYGVVSRLSTQQQVDVLARSSDQKWLLIESDNAGVSGWTATDSLRVQGSFDKLPVNNTPLENAQVYPTAKTFQRLVGVRDYPDWDHTVQATLWAGLDVIVMAQSAQNEWLYISHDLATGWIPRSAVVVEFDISRLPVWKSSPQNAEHDILALADDESGNTVAGVPVDEILRGDPEPNIQRATSSVTTDHAAVYAGPGISYNVLGELNQRDRPIVQARDETGQFVFVWNYRVDGWVLASNLQLSVDVLSLPVWSRPMHHAHEIATGRVAVANLNVRTEGSVDGEVIGQLLEGQRISIIGRNEASTWVYHSSPIGTGWSYAPLISLSQDIESLPVR